MKWNYVNKATKTNQGNNISNSQIVENLLNNRGFTTEKEQEEFLSPPNPYSLVPSVLGIDSKQLSKASKRIQKAIESQEAIVVYGDYDVDGICSTAILWETLRDLKASAMPFIPGREKEGYGLSIEGIKNILADEKYHKPKILITVDNGIVAHDAVEFANKSGLEVIILDHHEIGKTLPKAFAVVHTLEMCAAGITYFFSKELYSLFGNEYPENKLELATIATVADLVPLVGPNRSIVKYGLEELNNTNRPGLQALCDVAGIKKIGTYEIGYLIAPRINASGRIDSALVGLRLLCTRDVKRAGEYASQLNEINKERQGMVEQMVAHALENYELRIVGHENNERIIILEHESYHQGVIGLIAGKLVERYYLPAIVIAKGETTSKASARSISGFNIIEAIRDSSEFLLNAGGHPMAAGFSIDTNQITNFKLKITNYSAGKVTADLLERSLKVDMDLSLEKVNSGLLGEINKLAPFGIGNPEPVFASEVIIDSIRTMGADNKHLKLVVGSLPTPDSKLFSQVEAVGFGMGKSAANLNSGDKIDVAYCLSLNEYQGLKTLQLKIRDIKYGRTD